MCTFGGIKNLAILRFRDLFGMLKLSDRDPNSEVQKVTNPTFGG